jgi:hypothetical protein
MLKIYSRFKIILSIQSIKYFVLYKVNLKRLFIRKYFFKATKNTQDKPTSYTIGVVIPLHEKHLIHLEELLHYISLSSILPNQVSISVSSCTKAIILNDYPFEIFLTTNRFIQNPSENRNIAATRLKTNIISFIDADDLPYFRRFEFILRAFELGSQVVLHNYFKSPNRYDFNFHQLIGDLEYKDQFIDFAEDSHSLPSNRNLLVDYHCAHLSLKSDLFKKYKFNENNKFLYREDSEFVKNIFHHGVKPCYINNYLSFYYK